MRQAAFALMLLPLFASAQVVEDAQMDSIRAPLSSEVAWAAQFQLEALNPTTGKPVLTGTATKFPSINLMTQDVILANLVGNKTTTVTVTGIRATFTAVPGPLSGWEPLSTFAIRKPFRVPFVLPAGSFVGCRYDMPNQFVDWLARLFTVRTGNLKCGINIKADMIPPHDSDTPPAAVVIIASSITDGDVLSATVTWTATPSVMPQRVEFYVDGQLLTTELVAPYQFNGDPGGVLNTLAMANGPHTLAVKAYMTGGQVYSRTINVSVAN